jgi:hypothetical protein
MDSLAIVGMSSQGGRMRRGARGEGGHGKCREAAVCIYNGPTWYHWNYFDSLSLTQFIRWGNYLHQ